MSRLENTVVFNQNHSIIEGWYWLLPSKDLKKGKVKHVELMGEKTAVYRGEDGKVGPLKLFVLIWVLHLAEGKVEGNQLRCFFHAWRFDEEGKLNDIPCRKKLAQCKNKNLSSGRTVRNDLVLDW